MYGSVKRLENVRNSTIYIYSFLVTVLLAVLLLVLSAFLPQSLILENIKESANMIDREETYPVSVDYMHASQLDNATDTLILLHSCETNSSNLSSVLTNPTPAMAENITESLHIYEEDDTPEITRYYVRYWMGFRTYIRLLLTVFNFWQIRRYLVFTVFVLFALVICSICKWVGQKQAFLFALSIIMMRLHIIAQSMQFSCCFLIAFCAMLLVPWIYKRGKYETLFFMELGMVTMYFDFYTTPVITLGLPLIYLYSIHANNNETTSVKQILMDAIAWLLGYASMWMAKLILTTVFTDVNAIENGLNSFYSRVGIHKDQMWLHEYDGLKALQSVFDTFCASPDRSGRKIVLAAFGLAAVLVIVSFIWKRRPLHSLKKNMLFLVIAAFPILWFIAAAQPTNIHAGFQYRGIVVTFWGIMSYALFTLQIHEKEKWKETVKS